MKLRFICSLFFLEKRTTKRSRKEVTKRSRKEVTKWITKRSRKDVTKRSRKKEFFVNYFEKKMTDIFLKKNLL